MGKVFRVRQILSKTYKTFEVAPVWLKTFGLLPDPFSMLVFGRPKNGKTSFIMRLCKHLCKFAPIDYVSIEEGESKTIQEVFERENLIEVDKNFRLLDSFSFNELIERLDKRRSAKIVVIDSRDYMKLTFDQYKKLTNRYPRKSFIIICWEQAGKPSGHYAKQIEFQVGAVVHVRNFKAYVTSRWGITEPYTIWKKEPSIGEQLNINTYAN